MAIFEIPYLSKADLELYVTSISNEIPDLSGDVLPPEWDDLYSLYSKVRTERSVAIIEYGSGWSTLVLAKALDENRRSYSEYVAEFIRHPNPFTLMTVDCSPEFQNTAL